MAFLFSIKKVRKNFASVTLVNTSILKIMLKKCNFFLLITN